MYSVGHQGDNNSLLKKTAFFGEFLVEASLGFSETSNNMSLFLPSAFVCEDIELLIIV